MSKTNKPIDIGDTVDVIYNNEFDFSLMGAAVEHMPQGEGDMWQVSTQAARYAINPYNHSLAYIRRTTHTDKQPEQMSEETARMFTEWAYHQPNCPYQSQFDPNCDCGYIGVFEQAQSILEKSTE